MGKRRLRGSCRRSRPCPPPGHQRLRHLRRARDDLARGGTRLRAAGRRRRSRQRDRRLDGRGGGRPGGAGAVPPGRRPVGPGRDAFRSRGGLQQSSGRVRRARQRARGLDQLPDLAGRPARAGRARPCLIPAQGRWLWTSQVVHEEAGNEVVFFQPQLAIDESAALVWTRADARRHHPVQAAFRPKGGSFGPAQALATGGFDPDVAVDERGNTIVVATAESLRVVSFFKPRTGPFGAGTADLAGRRVHPARGDRRGQQCDCGLGHRRSDRGCVSSRRRQLRRGPGALGPRSDRI